MGGSLCDYVTTLSVSRLIQPGSHIPRLGQEEFDGVVALMMRHLPSMRP